MSADKLELEQQRRKLETLGRLAGNVVHDFNNMLMVIEGYTRMLLEEPNLSGSAKESAHEILRASERAAALTKQLLAFARKKSVESKGIEINAMLRQMRNMLMRLLGETVLLEFDLSDESCLVFANESQMEQVLLNLIVNARDAMPIGGRIVVRTTVLADTVRLIIEDTGIGIPNELLPRIFEPFFTTKDPGKGTGIGLSLVDEIVRGWEGTIDVTSELEQGTRFTIEVPLFHDPLATAQAAIAPAPKAGRILLVEDEDGVRSLIRRVLDQRHFHVLEAATEEGALDLARSETKLDLLITDLELKQGEGRNLAQLVRIIHPGIKVIYISGYVNESGGDGELTLQKPFSPYTLVLAVQELLKSR